MSSLVRALPSNAFPDYVVTCIGSKARFSKVPKCFRARNVVAESQTLWFKSCFIHVFLIWTEFLFIQEVLDVYTSLFLDTDKLKIALGARKVSGAFEKRVPAPNRLDSSLVKHCTGVAEGFESRSGLKFFSGFNFSTA